MLDITTLSTWTTLLLALLCYRLLRRIYLTIYRLYLHPLSRFPGPKLTAATSAYEFYQDVLLPPQGQFTFAVERMHATYGPIVRINTHELSISDLDFFDTLYTAGSAVRDRDPKAMEATGSPLSVTSTVDHYHHRLRRAALDPYFSTQKVLELEPAVKDKVGQLCSALKGCMARGEVVELYAAFTALTTDVISGYCFGEAWGALSAERYSDKWRDIMDHLLERGPIGKHMPWLTKALLKLPVGAIDVLDGHLGAFVRSSLEIREQVERIKGEQGKEEKRTDGKGSKTVFDQLLATDLPKSELTVDRLTQEGFVMVVAGTEPIARVLSNMCFYLLDNPDMLARLKQELKSVMPTGSEEVDWKVLEGLPYLRACVQEALRVTTPVLNRSIVVAPNEALKYGDWIIPPGTSVSINFRTVLLNPDIFPEPLKFNPDRWIEAAERGENLTKYLVTFSKGSRNCLGQNLAYAEIYLTAAHVLRSFEFELYDTIKERDVDVARDCLVGLPTPGSKGVRVKITGESK